MLRNYVRIAWRNLVKHRGTTLINLAGLSIGLACALIILVYVRYETGYDGFHAQSDRLYRVLTIDEALGVSSNLVGITLPALGPAMAENIPGVARTARFLNAGRTALRYGEERIYTEHLKLIEPAFFEMFDYPMRAGNPAEALKAPRTAVVTEAMARRMFGEAEPVGQVFENQGRAIKVVAVMADPPAQSHLQFDVMISLYPAEADSNLAQFLQSWGAIAMTTYAQLQDPGLEPAVEAEMEKLIREHEVGENFKVTLQPLDEVHLGSSDILFDGYNVNKTDATYVYTLLVVAFFIILIAAFNFMNLSTARSARRAREVGMRKVLGALRGQLIGQFLSESVLLCLLSLGAALLLTTLVSEWAVLDLPRNAISLLVRDVPLLLGLLGGTLLLGLLSGSYPAFLLSSFQPVKVLKGRFTGSGQGLWLRRALVVVQFTVSIAMITGTLIVYSQLDLIRSQDKGFDPEQVVVMQLNDQGLQERFPQLRSRLEALPTVRGVSTVSSMPGEGYGRNGIQPEGASEDDTWIVSVMSLDEGYLPLMGMEMAEGRNFSREFGTDSAQAVLINEAMARELRWTGEAVGKKIGLGPTERTVVGVIEDFHFASMRHRIEPLMVFFQPQVNGTLAIKLDTRDLPATLAEIQGIWREINPHHPFAYTFFDQDFAQLYRSEQQFSELINQFTWLAIFIACLGLLGLSAFTAEQRTREMGIRKVLGATVPQILVLLSREFTYLVAIAALVAVPVAWYAMGQWLENFAYRIDMPWWAFLLAGVVALGIALVTNAYHALRTARANPTEALRYE